MARIALVHDVAGIAGVQAQILRRAGHDVDQISLPQLGASWHWPAKGVALPLRLAAYIPTVGRLRSGKYDVIHIHWLTHGIAGEFSGRPYFAQAHGSDVYGGLKNPIYRPVTRTVLKHAKAVFYVTPDLREQLKEAEGKLRYLPNPIDVDALSPKAMPTRVERALIFARLDPIKGVDRIFPAVERLSQAVELTALRWGPLADIYSRNYGRWVRFVPPVAHAEIGPFLQQFDVVIGQMRQGSLGLSELESLAAGRPVITGIDWNLYRDDPPPVVGVSGPDRIMDAVAELKNGPAHLADLAREGMAWTRRNHGLERHLELLEAGYFA